MRKLARLTYFIECLTECLELLLTLILWSKIRSEGATSSSFVSETRILFSPSMILNIFSSVAYLEFFYMR